VAATCPSCGAAVSGPYCESCGVRVRARPPFAPLVRSAEPSPAGSSPAPSAASAASAPAGLGGPPPASGVPSGPPEALFPPISRPGSLFEPGPKVPEVPDVPEVSVDAGDAGDAGVAELLESLFAPLPPRRTEPSASAPALVEPPPEPAPEGRPEPEPVAEIWAEPEVAPEPPPVPPMRLVAAPAPPRPEPPLAPAPEPAAAAPTFMPVFSAPPTTPIPSLRAVTWTVLVASDRVYFDRMKGAGGRYGPAVAFPAHTSERRIRLTGSQMRIGRRSATREVQPEIDVAGQNGDPGISRLHAVLTPAPDGTWSITDPGSANGTLLNGREIKVGRPVTLHEGDRINLGAWTVITVHRG
jgi:FHA domain